MESKTSTLEKIESPLHFTSIILFTAAVFLGYVTPEWLWIGYGLFFLMTSIKMVWRMLVIMLFAGLLVFVFPFLAPVVFVIMVILFIARIKYVFDHWKPIVAGLFIYGTAIPLYYRSRAYGFQLINESWIEPIIVAFVCGLLLHFVLAGMYRSGYTPQSALGIMGNVPLIIISFILPFLKIHIPVGDHVMVTETHAFDGHAGGLHHGTVEPGVIHSAHSVHHGHHAAGESGMTHVQAHFRTAPDGDPTNNLSYDGPNAKAPDLDQLVAVKDYMRTAPGSDNFVDLDTGATREIPLSAANVLPSREERKAERGMPPWIFGIISAVVVLLLVIFIPWRDLFPKAFPVQQEQDQYATVSSSYRDVDSAISDFMLDFGNRNIEAISNRQFGFVAPYLDMNGEAYEETRSYLNYLGEKGITEELVGLQTNKVEKLGDDAYLVTTYEAYHIFYSDGSAKFKSFNSEYKITFQDQRFYINKLIKTEELESRDL